MQAIKITDDDLEQLYERFNSNDKLKALVIKHRGMLLRWMGKIVENGELANSDETREQNTKVFEEMVRFMAQRVKEWMSWLEPEENNKITRHTCSVILQYTRQLIQSRRTRY